ncbi:hypothetical protein CFC21_107007 [Triticum aestivum]|uniref:rRNA N-glycosylase n=2 Tax=Triticum aestivum TaxID=4565 RepID=A0A3B6T8P9_WHEAT|nr:protein synthesis inhibitor II-like [Triticum aestivum]KAF7106265.1 hypothetical protein CFC21_107007 [Triticum aestivum]
MGSFFPNTGRRAQPPGSPSLFAMGFFASLVVFMLLIAPSRQQEWGQPAYARTFELETSNYIEVPIWLDQTADLIRASQIVFHPVLPPQQLHLPPNPWIFQLLRGLPLPDGSGHEAIAMAIRPDNRYWLGYFTFRTGRWHAFAGAEGFFENPIPLGFDSSYSTLVGGWKNLQYVPLGKTAAEQAVTALFWSNFGTKRTKKALKKSAAGLLVMFLEGHRFFPIRNFVEQHWNSDHPAFLSEKLARLVVNWSDISCSISYWAVSGDWASGDDAQYLIGLDIGVSTVGEALSTIYPILQAKHCRKYP